MSNPLHQAILKSFLANGVKQDSRLLLGVSGGVDSMVMLHVMNVLQHKVTVAHVNFQLRGDESDQDALLVKTWCERHHIPFRLLEMNTTAFAEEHNLNTQLAARKIRYDWWEMLRTTEAFDFIVTAHHLDDDIETFFLNVLRGTGLKGLQGMVPRREHIFRPMLSVTRSEIEDYAREHNIPFRTDRTNLSDDYQRNKIRHHLVPLLNEITPGFPSRMKHNLLRLEKEWAAWESAYRQWMETKIISAGNAFKIVSNEKEEGFLLRWLEEKGIPWNLALDFISSKEMNTGQVLRHHNICLFRTNVGYHLENETDEEMITIDGPGEYRCHEHIFSITRVSSLPSAWPSNPDEEYVSSSAISFPLQIRQVQQGDTFQPLGMKGKQKKIQDLLVDRKLEMHEKSKVRLLTNAHHILWVIGIQLDERARIRPGETEGYKVEWKKG